MMKPSMKWLTNTHRSEAHRMAAQLRAGWIGRRIVQGGPKPTETESRHDLHVHGMVGLYHVGADDPVSVELIMPGDMPT